MKLRVCDSGRERIVPASLELVEHTFAPSAAINDGTEPLRPAAAVLDVGCGSGRPLTRHLVERGFRVTGLDI